MSKQQTNRTIKTRQPNHQGTPQKLPNGTYRYQGYVNGQRISGSVKKLLKDAKADYVERVNAVLAPVQQVDAVPISLEDYTYDLLKGLFMARQDQELLSPKTWQLYEQIYRINIKGSELGGLELVKVVPSDIELWASALRTRERKTQKGKKVFPSRPMKNSSKRRYLGMLQSVFEHAHVSDRIIPSNPVAKVPKPAEEEICARSLTQNERRSLLKMCASESDENGGKWRNERRKLIVLLGMNGFGPAEICGLKFEDFSDGGLTPKRQTQRLGALGVVHRSRLKTRKRSSWVIVRKELVPYLRESKTGWIVPTQDGKPMEPGNLRKVFQRMVAGTEFADVNPYDLRHTFANELIDNGIDVKTAADMMRHSVEVFLKRYVRSNRDKQVEAMKKLKL